MSKKKIISIVIGILVVATVLVCSISYIKINYSKLEKTRFIKTSLDTGNKFLLEGNYELAIAEFLEVINLDPNNIDAYMGIARAYKEAGNINKESKEYDAATENYANAIIYLKKALEVTDDEAIKTKLLEQIAEIEALMDGCESEIHNNIEEEDYAYIHELSSAVWGASLEYHYARAIPESSIREQLKPYLEEINKYIEKGYGEADDYHNLMTVYWRIGELEKAREIRDQGYKKTNDPILSGQGGTVTYDGGKYTYNEFGVNLYQETNEFVVTTEYEGNRVVSESFCDITEQGENRQTHYYEYDSEGRFSRYEVDYYGTDGDADDSIGVTTYRYEGNTVTDCYENYKPNGVLSGSSENTYTINPFGSVDRYEKRDSITMPALRTE